MSFKVGTYNLANLLAPASGPWVAKSPRQMELLARNIERSGVDIMAVQEVQSEALLRKFLELYLPDRFPHVTLLPGNDPRGIHVAILSRFPLQNPLSHAELRFPLGDRTSRFSRDALRVEVEIAGEPWSLFAVHLKSRAGGAGSDSQRVAEARALRRIVREANPARFIVAGDFNDQAHSPALQTMLGDGTLLSALDRLPPKRRVTYPAKNPKRQLDFLLYPALLEERLMGARVWQEARCSDHCLVVAEFTVPGAEQPQRAETTHCAVQ